MQSGLRVELDPGGGNEVNVRAVLRAAGLRWGTVQSRPSDEDAASDADAPDDASDSASNPAPRARDIGEYDLDDDFIDDDELVIEDNPPPALRLGRVPTPEDPLLFSDDQVLARDEALPVLQPVDPGFYVNRGVIRSKPKLNSAQKKQRAKLAAKRTAAVAEKQGLVRTDPTVVDVDMVPVPSEGKKASIGKESTKIDVAKKDSTKNDAKKKIVAQDSDKKKDSNESKDSKDVKSVKPKPKKTSPADAPASTTSTAAAKRPLKQQALTPQGKLAKSADAKDGTAGDGPSVGTNNGESVPKKRRTDTSDASGRFSLGRPLPHAVAAEVTALQALTVNLFGDRKPVLSDAILQARLHVLFCSAQANGCAKLFSDLAKENRRLVLVDELWGVVSKFLRTTRQHLEHLGHALHWNSVELKAAARVETAERKLVAAVASSINAGRSALSGDEVDKSLWEWYRAKAAMQEARNQLGTRPRTVKKVLGSWVTGLKKSHFLKIDGVTESGVLDAIKRMEDERAAAEKKRKDMEKEARRRRKEDSGVGPKAGTLPKKMAEALPPGLRGLASLKARPGSAAVGSASVTSAVGSGAQKPTGEAIGETGKKSGSAVTSAVPRPAPSIAKSLPSAGQASPQFEVIEID